MDNDDSLVGQLVADRYALSRLIGRGGMASVYQAWDTRLERFVAVKVFSIGTANNDARRESEIKLLARVNHPNLVTLHDAHLALAGSDAPSFIVMELVEGPDLRARLAQGTTSLGEEAGLIVDLAQALMAIHNAGIIHRDLKPGNILLAPTGLAEPAYRAKIADFGIAHLVGAEPLTTAGTVIGTAAYLSPEQAMGQEATPATDIYSLGLIVLESLTGDRAFTGTLVESISARLARDPEIPASMPSSWAALLARMTARDPADRPDALEVVSVGRELAAESASLVPGDSAETPTERMLPPTRVMPVAPPTIATKETKTTGRVGATAALLSLIAATIVVIVVGASTLFGVETGSSPSGDSTPTNSGTTETSAVPMAPPSASLAPSPSASTAPIPPATPPAPGKGKGKGKNPPGKHKHG